MRETIVRGVNLRNLSRRLWSDSDQKLWPASLISKILWMYVTTGHPRPESQCSWLSFRWLTSVAWAGKCPNRCSWLWFRRLLEPTPESFQIDAPGYHFVDFWSQGQKVIKSILLAIISSTSGARAGKSSNRCSWLWFRWLLELTPESFQIDCPGYHPDLLFIFLLRCLLKAWRNRPEIHGGLIVYVPC